MEIFTSKIKCNHCGKFYKRKNERGRYKWVCQGYDNYLDCKRNVIDEERMKEFIGRRIFISDRTEDSIVKFINEKVDRIEVEDKDRFKVIILNAEPMFQMEGHFQY